MLFGRGVSHTTRSRSQRFGGKISLLRQVHCAIGSRSSRCWPSAGEPNWRESCACPIPLIACRVATPRPPTARRCLEAPCGDAAPSGGIHALEVVPRVAPTGRLAVVSAVCTPPAAALDLPEMAEDRTSHVAVPPGPSAISPASTFRRIRHRSVVDLPRSPGFAGCVWID